MNLLKRKNTKGDKTYYHYDFGRGKGQRPATGVFVYTKPKDQIQKNHNKQALALLEVKKSQAIIEQQSIGTAYIPAHKFKDNFPDYYEEYVNTVSQSDFSGVPFTGERQKGIINLHQLYKIRVL